MSEKSSHNLDHLQHPTWCDRNRCTATPSASKGGAHHSAPTTFTDPASIARRLEITGSLYQAHAPWQTATYLDLEFSGLEHDWKPITATLHVTTDRAVALGRFLTDLGQIGEAEQAAQIRADLSALSKGVGSR